MAHGGRTVRVLWAAIAAGLLLHGVALLRGGGGGGAPEGWPPAARADGVAAWPGSGKLFVTSVKDGAGILVWNLDASTVDYYEADLRFTAPSGIITSVVHGSAAIPKK